MVIYESGLRRGILALGVVALLLLALHHGAAAQSGSVSGRWVGGYLLGDGWEAVVVTLEEDGYLVPRRGAPVQLTELEVRPDAVSFRAGEMTFEGDLLDEGTVAGLVRRGEVEGSFVLMPLSATTLDVYDSAIGTYRLTDDRVLLLGRSDGPDSLFVVEDERVVPIVPTGPDRFLTALGEEVVLSRGAPEGPVDGLAAKPWSRPEISYPSVGERVELYQEEQVQFGGGLSGSLLLPPGDGPYPAVVLIHGAGASQREHYRIYGDYIARHGVAALIYDKRGEEAVELDGLASDAMAGADFLKNHPLIDPERVGVWGISQGGRVAPMVAVQDPEVAFVVVLSAPGYSADRLALWRIDRQGQAAGYPDILVEMILKATRLRGSWDALMSSGAQTGDLAPLAFWSDVSQPVLLIYGGLDSVVPPGESAAAILDALEAGGNRQVSVSLYAAADHNLMVPAGGGVEALAPGMMGEMVEWIQTGHSAGGFPVLDRTGAFEAGGPFGPTEWHQCALSHLLVTLFAGLVLIGGLARGLWARFRVRRHYGLPAPDRIESLSMLLGSLGCTLLWQFWVLVGDLEALGAEAVQQLYRPAALPLTLWSCLALWGMSLLVSFSVLRRVLGRGDDRGASERRRMSVVMVMAAVFVVLAWVAGWVVLR